MRLSPGRTLAVLALVLFATTATLMAEGPEATVEDLSWMVGSWQGEAMGGMLQETWTAPEGSTMTGLVRAWSGDATSMVELIVIEEENGSLVLRLQQFDKGFKARSEPQPFELSSVEENKVVWKATGEGGLAGLGYSSPEPGKFVISVETPTGQKFDIPLSAN